MAFTLSLPNITTEMKKIILIGLALTTALAAKAAVFLTQSFLPPGVVAEVITNNQSTTLWTNTASTTNTQFLTWGNNLPTTFGNAQTLWAYTNTITFIPTATTIGGSSGITITGVTNVLLYVSPELSNYYGVYWTNEVYVLNTNGYTITNNLGSNQFTTYPQWRDVVAFADANGNQNSNMMFTVAVTGDTVKATNILTFNFQRQCSTGLSEFYPQLQASTGDYDGADLFTFNVTMTGTNQVVVSTNPPLQFITGSKKYHLQSIVVGTNNSGLGTNIFINEIKLGGFAP
jgi:hypothetical protein